MYRQSVRGLWLHVYCSSLFIVGSTKCYLCGTCSALVELAACDRAGCGRRVRVVVVQPVRGERRRAALVRRLRAPSRHCPGHDAQRRPRPCMWADAGERRYLHVPRRATRAPASAAGRRLRLPRVCTQGRRQVKICGVKRHGERGARAYNGGLEAERSPLPPCKNSSDLYQFSKSGVIWICPPQSTLWRRHCLYRLSFALENTTGGKLAAAQSDGARDRVTRIQILFACPIKQHQLISIILPAQH